MLPSHPNRRAMPITGLIGRALKRNYCQAVMVSGFSGVGKSELCSEFLDRLGNTPKKRCDQKIYILRLIGSNWLDLNSSCQSETKSLPNADILPTDVDTGVVYLED